MSGFVGLACVCDCGWVAASLLDADRCVDTEAGPEENVTVGDDWRDVIRRAVRELADHLGLPISAMCTVNYSGVVGDDELDDFAHTLDTRQKTRAAPFLETMELSPPW